MKKTLSLILMLSLVLSSVSISFAKTTLSDIENTPYQTAVENLIAKGIVSGYTDNTFKPANSISRAEACVIAVKAMNPTQQRLNAIAQNSFPDVSDSYWGSTYINYASGKGIVSGYNDGIFLPQKEVSYYEMAAMLINAMGYKNSDLSGTWPDNYYNKAKELGIFKDIAIDSGFNGNLSATRGDVALMANPVVDQIAAENAPAEEETPIAPPKEDPKDDNQSGDSNNSSTSSSGALSDFTGRAYGMVLEVSTVMKDGEKVQQLKFLYGKEELELLTKKENTFNTSLLNYDDGHIFCLKMNNGIVTDVSKDGSSIGSKTYREFTDEEFTTVSAIDGYTITIKNTDSTETYTIDNDAKIYVAKMDGSSIDSYESGSVRSIKKDAKVRLYSVTDNASADGPVEIVVLLP